MEKATEEPVRGKGQRRSRGDRLSLNTTGSPIPPLATLVAAPP
jgi:hypothetical protein